MALHQEEYIAQSVEHRLQSPQSGSKRKRVQETVSYTEPVPEIGNEFHSPKRSRSNRYLSDRQPSVQPSSPQLDRGIRRIKGKYSLSALSRHQAPEDLRPSRFKEGSMNDKPSEKPPSVFIRSPNKSTVTPDEVNMEHLMDQYHDGALEDTVEDSIRGPSRADTVVVSQDVEQGSGVYRFGKMIASSFNPMSMWKSWSKVWDETRDDITIRNIEENRRKAAQKALAVQKYAEMKSAGQIKTGAYTAVKQYNDDEAVDEDDGEVVAFSARNSQLSLGQDKPLPDIPSRGPTPSFGGQSQKTLKPRKSLFSIRVPSISGTIKRTRSIHNLPEVNHHSSSTISPDKHDRPLSGLSGLSGTLHRSHSRKDLSRQEKLSKRVSDLELKLQDARRDLNTAITNVSPLPNLPSRFERYTPNFKLQRPKFVPSGNLPSLPSEGVLFPSLRNKKRSLSQTSLREDSHVSEVSQSTIRAVDPEATIRAHRTVTTFEHENFLAMDPASIMNDSSPAKVPEEEDHADYADLDTKLKGLEKSHQARKPVRTKKRKSGGEEGKLFKPDKTDNYANDDAEWDSEDAKPKKRKVSIRRRKSKMTKTAQKGVGAEPADSTTGAEQSHPVVEASSPVVDSVIADETANSRSSMDSQASHRSSNLEPISEEDTSIVTHPQNGDHLAPPTTGHTPGIRSRSPNPRSVVAKIAEETETVGHLENTPSKIRIASPPASENLSKPAEPFDGEVRVKPGMDSVPEMPTSPQQRRRKATKGPKENFEWPEDVF
ncbi:hypothetical protein MBLNU457_6963t1 [Dothideomycetes sp. NU457]